MPKIKLKRDKSHEFGKVLRWYQSGRTALVTVVEGDNPKNVEWRVSYGFNAETYLGSKKAFEQKTEAQKKRKAEFLVNKLGPGK